MVPAGMLLERLYQPQNRLLDCPFYSQMQAQNLTGFYILPYRTRELSMGSTAFVALDAYAWGAQSTSRFRQEMSIHLWPVEIAHQIVHHASTTHVEGCGPLPSRPITP